MNDRAGESGGNGFGSFLMRPLLANPKDALAILVAAAMTAAIAINALFMQAGRHPSPMFGQTLAPLQQAAHPLPRARPLAEAKMIEPRAPDVRPAEPRASESVRTAPPAAEPARSNDPMGQLVARTTGPVPSPVPRPPAAIPARTEPKADPVVSPPASQRRIAAVQRALTEFGYGQLKPTGVAGTETQAAIAKFEKERKLPVTGQVTERMVRELATVTGRPIE